MSAAGWLAIAVVVGALIGVTRLARPRVISDEEFERESKRPSLLRTGLAEFHGFLQPDRKAGVEAIEQEKKKTDIQVSGDPPDTAKLPS